MSVAFRRESDEEHLEPKFELPIPPGPNLVTDRGFALIQARHDESEPAAGRIACSAPLARAMNGAEVGDEVELADEPIAIIEIEVA